MKISKLFKLCIEFIQWWMIVHTCKDLQFWNKKKVTTWMTFDEILNGWKWICYVILVLWYSNSITHRILFEQMIYFFYLFYSLYNSLKITKLEIYLKKNHRNNNLLKPYSNLPHFFKKFKAVKKISCMVISNSVYSTFFDFFFKFLICNFYDILSSNKSKELNFESKSRKKMSWWRKGSKTHLNFYDYFSCFRISINIFSFLMFNGSEIWFFFLNFWIISNSISTVKWNLKNIFFA